MISIAHYSSDADISGATTFVGELVRKLISEGESVSILLHHFGTDPNQSDFRHQMLGVGAQVESEQKPYFTEDAVHSTLSFLQRHRPRLFLPQCLPAHFYAAAIAGEQGLPWVYTIHSDDPDYWIPLNQIRPAECNGRIVSVSKFIAEEVSRLGHPAGPVIPCGVCVPDTISKRPDKPFRVVYSGRVVERQKRISLVVATFRRLCEINAEAECAIVGGGPDLEDCKNAVEASGFSSRIRFTGRLDAAGVAGELDHAHAMLLMSDFEGLPVALLEAMARGVVPVVRLIRSGVDEVVVPGTTGAITSCDPLTAATELNLLAADTERIAKLSAGARSMVSRYFSVDFCHSAWLALCKELSLASDENVHLEIPGRLKLPRRHLEIGDRDIRRPVLLERIQRSVKSRLRGAASFFRN